MYYGKQWTRNDIEHVVVAMKENDRLFHNGIIFFKTAANSPDLMLQYLFPMIENAGGAAAIAMIRSIVVSSNAEHPAPCSQFLLDNSAVNDPLVPIIAFSSGLLQEKHHNKLRFTLAHEVAHVLSNDLDPSRVVEKHSAEDLKREMAADTNAVAILGERKSGIETLEYILRVFETPEFREGILNGTTSPEVFATSVNQLKQRAINIVQGA